MIPRYLPMDSSESENSDNDDHEQAQQQYQRETVGPEHEGRTNLMLDNARLDIDGGEDFIYDEAHGNIPESPREQIRRRIDDFRRKRLARTRSGSYIADPSKRTSLFLELQNLQAENLVGGQHPTIPALNQHHHLDSGFELEGKSRQDQDLEPMNDSVLSPVFDSFTAGYSLEPLSTTATTTTAVLSPTTPSRSLDFELFDSELGSPVTLTPRRRASFPPRRSDRIRIQHAEELQQVIQRVDAELDRTVETIDDLTRDLIAVAMHQNWMKAHLERTLGLQSPLSLTDFIQTDDSPFSMATAMVGESGVGTTSPKNPTIPRNRLEQIEDVIGATKALLSSKEFANYYQVLERVRIMEEDVYDDYEQDGGEAFEGSSSADTKQGHQQQQQRFSGSSFTLTNGSFRHSSSSTLSLETRFGSYADVKDGVPLTSSSNRPSIEWSDRIGAPYNNMSQDRIHPLAAPTSLEPLQQDPLSLAVSPSPIQRLELIGDQPSKQETTQQDQHPKTLSSLLFQITQEEGVVNDLSPDATLAIDKLILAVTHLVLLLFWTMALFLGVVITDGSILKNASRQLISSVEILQSHFTVPDSIHDDDDNLDRGLYSPATQDQGIKTTDKKQDEAQELDQTLLKTMLDSVPAPKPLRPYSSTSRRRRTRLSSQQRHHNHHILLRRRQSSLLPQINAPEQGGEGVFGGSLFTSILGVGRFYNSPFLASSRYQVDISSKEPKAIQLGTGHGPLSVPSTSASTSSPTTTSTVLPESFPSSCSSTNYLQDQDFLSSSISTVSSSATLLDWLDSATFSATNLTHTQGSRQKKDAQISTTSSTDNSNSNENISKGPSYESAAAPLGIN
ncbi:hypothetical protein EC991_004337 [Linnemannia zychae]|nr:hypothetical protein EC991_004337 [Linnemannia zychae]